MKKIVLTIIAVGFGATVSFAQVTGSESQQQQQQENVDEIIITEREAVQREGEEEQRTRLSMQDLPEEVQDGFQESEYSEYQVLGVFELDEEAAAIEVEDAEGSKVYAFELLESGQQQDDPEGGAVVRQPDVVVHFDEEGERLKAKDPQKIRNRNID